MSITDEIIAQFRVLVLKKNSNFEIILRPSPFVWSMQKMALPQGLQKPCREQLRGRVQLWRPEKYNLIAKMEFIFV